MDYIDNLSDSQKFLQFGPNWQEIRDERERLTQNAENSLNNFERTKAAFNQSIESHERIIERDQAILDAPGNLQAEIDKLNGDMPALEESITKVNTRISALEISINNRFAEMQTQIDNLTENFQTQIDDLNQRLDEQENQQGQDGSQDDSQDGNQDDDGGTD